MSLSQQNDKLRKVLGSGAIALCRFLCEALNSDLEAVRVARSTYVLLAIGCSRQSTFQWDNIANYVAERQHKDGGWNDIEETAWALGYLSKFGALYHNNLQRGKTWLASVRLSSGAWGKTSRDQPRIPITSLVKLMTPEVARRQTSTWLTKEWKTDLGGTTPLTYKGAFYLLGQINGHTTADEKLAKRTISHLVREQNEDGGFAPWKGHPVGSDPWTTGIVLWGLASSGKLAPKTTIKRSIQWLESTQLPNGLWPYHYLDDGTAMALIGLSNALAVLRN